MFWMTTRRLREDLATAHLKAEENARKAKAYEERWQGMAHRLAVISNYLEEQGYAHRRYRFVLDFVRDTNRDGQTPAEFYGIKDFDPWANSE